jgi:IS4 transposase
MGVFFVVRIPESWNLEMLTNEAINGDLPANKNILKAGKVRLESGKPLPEGTRLVEVWDEKNQSLIRLLTNHKTWTAATIADLYKCRWQIESLFKQIKQHLRIKSFVGTSENALRIQI